MNTKLRTRFATRLNPLYIKDSTGNRMVVLSHNEYHSILEEIEEWEDSMLYLKTKRADNGERISMKAAFAKIEMLSISMLLLMHYRNGTLYIFN
jgi:hypothetical protein